MKKKLLCLSAALVMVCFVLLGVNVQAAATTAPYNPEYNAATGQTRWNYVYFGRFPQSEVTGDELTDEIINAPYNQNGDVVVDGVKYRREYANKHVTPKTYKYYRYEPVKWRVLQNTGNSLLLLSDLNLWYVEDISSDATRKHDYAISNLRSALNGYDGFENWDNLDYSVKGTNFFSMAFYEKEQDILELLAAADTGKKDYVTIPSYELITNAAYGFGSDKTRVGETTDYLDRSMKERFGNVAKDWSYIRNKELHPVPISGSANYSAGSYGAARPLIRINIDSELWSMVCPETVFEVKDMQATQVKLSGSTYTYDGKAKKPKVTVTDGGETLTEGIDYFLSYRNNIQAGTASVDLQGTGDYVGTKTVCFTINQAEQKLSV